jgi:hypothetical protein
MMGESQTGKTELINSLLEKKIKKSGLENLAGYLMYNQRILVKSEHSEMDAEEERSED